jgi:hypothetical protein
MKKMTECALRGLAAPIGALASIAVFPENLQEKGFVALILGSAYVMAFFILQLKPSVHRLIYTFFTTTLSIFATTLGGTLITNKDGFKVFENLFKMIVATTATLPVSLVLCIPGFVAFFILDVLFIKFFSPSRSAA